MRGMRNCLRGKDGIVWTARARGGGVRPVEGYDRGLRGVLRAGAASAAAVDSCSQRVCVGGVPSADRVRLSRLLSCPDPPPDPRV